MSLSDIQTTRASHGRHSPPYHGACAHLAAAYPRHGHRCKADGQRCDKGRAVPAMLPNAFAGGSSPPAPLQRHGIACRDPSLHISTHDPPVTPRLGSSPPEVIDHDSASSTLLPRPPLQSTSIVESDGEAVDLDVSDCARARVVPAARCNALPEELVLPASTSIDAARPTPVPS